MADEPKMTASRPVEPVTVAIIGTGDGSRLPSGTEAITPQPNQPNVFIKVVSPIAAIAIRFVNSYIGSLAGILAGAMASQVIPADDFYHLFLKCAGLALAGSVLLTLKDIVTVFSGLEKKFPLASGSV